MEELVYDLGKDVASMAATQKACQTFQAKTTENVDKLAGTVQVLLKETTKLETIFSSISSIDSKVERIEKNLSMRINKVEGAYSLWSRAVIGAIFVSIVGVIFKYAGV